MYKNVGTKINLVCSNFFEVFFTAYFQQYDQGNSNKTKIE